MFQGAPHSSKCKCQVNVGQRWPFTTSLAIPESYFGRLWQVSLPPLPQGRMCVPRPADSGAALLLLDHHCAHWRGYFINQNGSCERWMKELWDYPVFGAHEIPWNVADSVFKVLLTIAVWHLQYSRLLFVSNTLSLLYSTRLLVIP